MQQPETRSAAGKLAGWRKATGAARQGRAGHGSSIRAHTTVPWARGDARGGWQSLTSWRWGTASSRQAPAKPSPGAAVLEAAKLGPGNWAGGGSGTQREPGRTWEGEGCQLPLRGRAPLSTHLSSPRQQEQGALCPGVLPCTPGSPLLPRVLPCTSGSGCTPGCSPAPQALPCTRGCPQHSGSFHGKISLAPVSHPRSGHPRYPPYPLCSGPPRLVLTTRWHSIPITLGTQAVQPGAEGLADGGTSPPANPCPRLSSR